MSGGFAPSIKSSSSACSSFESTSFRVDTWCCDSTTRQAASWSRPISESPAHRVQILDDIDETLHRPDPLDGDSADVIVHRLKPVTRLDVIPPYECVERAIESEKKKSEFSLF